jgi:hypothetical protein
VGAIAFSAFVWSPPEGEIPLPSGEPDAPGIVLGSFDPGGEAPSFDPRAVGIIETATPPLTEGGADTEGGTGTEAPGGGLLPGRGSPTPGTTPTPGGGGGPSPDPTPSPTPEPTPELTPPPTPTPTPDPTPTPTPDPTPPPPSAAFEVNVTGLRAKFTNQSTNADAWAWSFGDGATSSGRSPSHTYGEAGTYSVKLTVTSSGGVTDSVTRSVTVGD